MIRALSTAATGMQAQETKLDQIAVDMANMNTTAYKRGRTEFQDLIYQNVKDAGGQAGVNQAPVGIQVGSGVKVSAQFSVHEQGPTKITQGLFDLMINGDGFFEIQLPGGQTAFTRDGTFKMDSEGRMVTVSGYQIVPNIQIPKEAAGVIITNTGEVRIITNGGAGEATVGNIQLASFVNPGAMRKIGENLYQGTVAAGTPTRGNPGDTGLGAVQQGAIEGSNVKATDSVMEMITTQRGYETNSKVMITGNEMWATTNSIIK